MTLFDSMPALRNWLRANRGEFIVPLLFLLLVALMLFSLTLGLYPLPVAEVTRIVVTIGPHETRPESNVPWARRGRDCAHAAHLAGDALAWPGRLCRGLPQQSAGGSQHRGVSSCAAFGGMRVSIHCPDQPNRSDAHPPAPDGGRYPRTGGEVLIEGEI